MKLRKSVLTAVLAGLLALGGAACGDEAGNTDTGVTEPAGGVTEPAVTEPAGGGTEPMTPTETGT